MSAAASALNSLLTLSNREEAAELYLSTKAIEYHLSNILAKVGSAGARDSI